jgi:AAA domain/Bifunctional DNA primase/polymerase, N-terminal
LSRSFKIAGCNVLDLLAEGRQTVLPPSRHPSGCDYRWTGPDALEDVDPDELPELPADIIEQLAKALRPFGYQAEPERLPRGEVGEIDYNAPYRPVKAKAMADFDTWVPALNLYRCRRTRDGYAAVAIWRQSNQCNPPERRKLNLTIGPRGIVDWGDGQKGYSPIDLVAAALGCSPGEAFVWLKDRVDPIPEHIKAFSPQPTETTEREHLAASPVSVSAPPLDRADELLGLADWAPHDERKDEINIEPTAEEIAKSRDALIKAFNELWFKEKFGIERVDGRQQKVDQMIADAIRESGRDLDAGAHAQYMADALNTINLNQGAEREAKSDDKAPPKSDSRLLTLVWDGERELVFPTRLVQDLITENSIGLLAGESQAGKTFLAIDLTFALALGQRFFSKAVNWHYSRPNAGGKDSSCISLGADLRACGSRPSHFCAGQSAANPDD